MEYYIYKKSNSVTIYVGRCFVDDPDTKMDMKRVRKELRHHGQELLLEADISFFYSKIRFWWFNSSAKFIYVEDNDKGFEFVPLL